MHYIGLEQISLNDITVLLCYNNSCNTVIHNCVSEKVNVSLSFSIVRVTSTAYSSQHKYNGFLLVAMSIQLLCFQEIHSNKYFQYNKNKPVAKQPVNQIFGRVGQHIEFPSILGFTTGIGYRQKLTMLGIQRNSLSPHGS